MTKLSNLNPNFYKTIVQKAGRIQEVIYSTMDDFSILASDSLDGLKNAYPSALRIDVTKDVCIYADTLKICDSLIMPGRNIKIVCRHLILLNDINLNIQPADLPLPDPSRISTEARPFNATGAKKLSLNSGVVNIPTAFPSKAAPQFQYKVQMGSFDRVRPTGFIGADGHSGDSGEDAGEIVLIAQEYTNNGHQLTLIAKGGKGQIGQGGMNGQPASPAQNGVGTIIIKDKTSPEKYPFKNPHPEKVYELFFEVEGQGLGKNPPHHKKPVIAMDGSDGGAAGKGGKGGKGGRITLHIPDLSKVRIENSGGDHGTDGSPGKGTKGTPGASLDIYLCYFWKGGDGIVANARLDEFLGKVSFKKGSDGKNGTPPDRKADPGIGDPGHIIQNTFEPINLAKAFDSTYWLKILQHAKNLYHYEPPVKINDDDNDKAKEQKNNENKTNKAYVLLYWIQDILYEMDLDEIAKGKNGENPMEVVEAIRKIEVRDQADNNVTNFEWGRNIYGKTPDWVPLLKLETYQTMLQGLVGPFTEIETAFKDLVKQAETKSEKDISFNQSMDQLKRHKGILEEKMKYLHSTIPPIVLILENLTAELLSVEATIRSIAQELNWEIQHNIDCDISKIFKALEMIAFDPKNIMMALVQGANLLYNSLATIAGKDIKYVVKKFEKIEGKLENATQDIFNNDDKRESLLILKLDEFNNEMEKVEAKFPEGAEAMKKATETLRSLVQIRGDKIIEYNVTLSTILKYQNEIKTVQAKIDHLNSGISENTDPTLTGTVSYFAVMYQNLREQMMELVYTVTRAYQYWSIGMEETESVYEQLKKKVLWVESGSDSFAQFSAKDLTQAVAELILKVGKQKEVFFNQDPQTFPSGDVKSNMTILINKNSAPGFIEYLKASQKSSQKGYLKFPAIITGKKSDDKSVFTILNSGPLYNIRVNYIRPRLIFEDKGQMNIDAGVNEATFHIEHLGKETIYQSDQKEENSVEYEHLPTNTLFTQSFVTLSNGKDYGEGGNGNFHDANHSEFAGLGIYTNWKISLVNDPPINLSKLEAIEIEFGCEAYIAPID